MNLLDGPERLEAAYPDATPVARRALAGLPVAVIGAGPVGLAAAAHLLARGLEPMILEAGVAVGAAVRDWGHVPMFSPWRFNLDRAAVALLGAPWLDPAGRGRLPHRRRAGPSAISSRSPPPPRSHRGCGSARGSPASPAWASARCAPRAREQHPFELRTVDSAGHEGRLLAAAVIDASGTWTSPNPAGASGLPALGERAASRLHPLRHAGRAGRGARPLRRAPRAGAGRRPLGHRHPPRPGRTRGTGAGDPRSPGRSAAGTSHACSAAARRTSFPSAAPWARDCGSSSSEVRSGSWHPSRRTRSAARRMVRSASPERARAERLAIEADELVVATGLRPDLSFLAELRLDLDPALECPRALAPLIDPNEHSCGTVRPHGAAELAQPEPGLFLVGMKSYGRAPTFLLATGHEQVRSVAAHLAGDEEAARRVELELPETGVCNGPRPATVSCCGPSVPVAALALSVPAAGCCGGPAPAGADACCADDAVAKADGRRGMRLRATRSCRPSGSRDGLLRRRVSAGGRARRRGRARARAGHRRHRARGDANPGLGLVLLPAGRAGEADRRRHRLAAPLGRGRALAGPARGRPRSRRASGARSNAPAAGRSWRRAPSCSRRGWPAWRWPTACRRTSPPGW